MYVSIGFHLWYSSGWNFQLWVLPHHPISTHSPFFIFCSFWTLNGCTLDSLYWFFFFLHLFFYLSFYLFLYFQWNSLTLASGVFVELFFNFQEWFLFLFYCILFLLYKYSSLPEVSCFLQGYIFLSVFRFFWGRLMCIVQWFQAFV